MTIRRTPRSGPPWTRRPSSGRFLCLAVLAAAAGTALLSPGGAAPAAAPSSGAASGTSGSQVPGARADTIADRRPVPYPVIPSHAYRRAAERGTRTADGRPGPEYWTNYARYRIDAVLDTGTHRLSGRTEITYLNRSPDTLRRAAVHLRQNLFAPGAVRRDDVPVTGGVELSAVSAAGRDLSPADGRGTGPAYEVDGTVAWLNLPAPLAPGDSVELALEWSHEVPPVPSDGRQGREEGLYFMGYWYPQVAVYDDVSGWVAGDYTGQAEFYMGQADYDVRITVPAGWPVGATGVLQNPEQVLSERSRERLARARRTGDVVSVIGPDERGDGGATRASEETLTWHYRAESVRDFAWTASRAHLWDATRALVPGRDGVFPTGRNVEGPGLLEELDDDARPDTTAAPDTVMIHSFFWPTAEAAAWPLGGARYTRDAVEALSDVLWPYPYPQMTSVEGVLRGGGMEYPMVTVMRPWADTLDLAGDLMHEVAHNWFPMEVGSDEKRWVWMDEGLTQFNTAQGMERIYGAPREGGRPNDSEAGQRSLYLSAAGSDDAAPLMRHGDLYPRSVYFVLPYNKGAQVLSTLRSLVGEEAFWEAYREYGRRWRGKHPYPWDFFRTVEDVTGRDLDWFWRTWYYETWPLDQAIATVRREGDSTAIVVEDRGLAPMPVRLRVTRADGYHDLIEVPAEVWLEGATRHVVRVHRDPPVAQVEIDPEEHFPDVDRSNQVWRREEGG